MAAISAHSSNALLFSAGCAYAIRSPSLISGKSSDASTKLMNSGYLRRKSFAISLYALPMAGAQRSGSLKMAWYMLCTIRAFWRFSSARLKSCSEVACADAKGSHHKSKLIVKNENSLRTDIRTTLRVASTRSRLGIVFLLSSRKGCPHRGRKGLSEREPQSISRRSQRCQFNGPVSELEQLSRDFQYSRFTEASAAGYEMELLQL